MVSGTTDYVAKYPVATKRVLRAILKAADFCASNPELAAQELVDRGFLPNYDYALATLKETPHDNGGTTILKTRCGSMPCACRRRA